MSQLWKTISNVADFIFKKPKSRYEVLSGMLGLEKLIQFRNVVEEAKTLYSNNLPRAAKEAQSRAFLLINSMDREPLLKPVAAAIRQGNLSDGRTQFTEVALGRLPAGTKDSDILPALEKAKTAKERSKLDWGRFSLGPILSSDSHPVILELTSLSDELEAFRSEVQRIQSEITPEIREVVPAARRDFYALGIHLVDSEHPATCPFCAEDTLTPHRLAELRAQVESVPTTRISFTGVIGLLEQLRNRLASDATARRPSFNDFWTTESKFSC